MRPDATCVRPLCVRSVDYSASMSPGVGSLSRKVFVYYRSLGERSGIGRQATVVVVERGVVGRGRRLTVRHTRQAWPGETALPVPGMKRSPWMRRLRAGIDSTQVDGARRLWPEDRRGRGPSRALSEMDRRRTWGGTQGPSDNPRSDENVSSRSERVRLAVRFGPCHVQVDSTQGWSARYGMVCGPSGRTQTRAFGPDRDNASLVAWPTSSIGVKCAARISSADSPSVLRSTCARC